MDTKPAGNNTPPNNPLAGLQAWEAEMANLLQEQQGLETTVTQDQDVFNDLNGELTNDQTQLNTAETDISLWFIHGKVRRELQAEINSLKNNIAGLTPKVTAASKQLASDQQALTTFNKSRLGQFCSNTSASASNSAEASMNHTIAEQAASDAEAATEITAQNAAEQNRQNAFSAVTNDMQSEAALAADAIARIGNIVTDTESIKTDKQEETTLRHEIVKDGIALAACISASFWSFGASVAGAVYFTDQLAKARAALSNVETDVSHLTADLATQKAYLKTDMATLAGRNVQELNTLITSLFTVLGKVVALLDAKGKMSEGGMQQASCLLAQVMSIVELITAKVQQMRSEDQQWMSRANAASSEINTYEAQLIYQSIDSLEQYATFMKTVMGVTAIAATIASLVMAAASGGTMAWTMALVMAALTVVTQITKSNPLANLTTDLARAIDGGNDPAWAEVVSAVIITVLAVAITRTAPALASYVAKTAVSASTAVAASAVNEAEEIEMTEMGENAANEAVVIPGDITAEVGTNEMDVEMTEIGQSASQAAVSEAETAAQGVSQTVVNEARTAAQGASQTIIDRGAEEGAAAVASSQSRSFVEILNAIKPYLGLSVVYFGTDNGIVDLGELIYAASTHQMDASQTQLEQSKTLMWINIVTSILQAVAEMAAMKYVMGENNETALLQRIMGKLTNLSQIAITARGIQSAALAVSAGTGGALAYNSVMRGELTEELGGVNAQLNITKTLAAAAKAYEKKELGLFSSNLEQQVRTLQIMVRKNGEAEGEAAKVLQETAV